MVLRYRCGGGSWANAPVSHLDMLKSKWSVPPAGPKLVWFISFRGEGENTSNFQWGFFEQGMNFWLGTYSVPVGVGACKF